MFLDSEPRLQDNSRQPRLRDNSRPRFTRTATYPQNPTIGDSTPTTTTTTNTTPDDHEATPTSSVSTTDMGELRSHLEEDGEYTAPEVETIVTLYNNRHRSIHHRNFRTLVNN